MLLKPAIVFCCCFCYCLCVTAQESVWSPDSLSKDNPNYIMERYHRLLKYADPVSYLVFPQTWPVAKRRIPLQEGEGKKGYWLEGNLTNRFVTYKGKYYSPDWAQRARVTFDVGLVPRLTRDTSSPLLPFNVRFGLGLDYMITPLERLKHPYCGIWWTTIQLHHFSNGQRNNFYYDPAIKRNNYSSGDFSTNYYRAMVNYATYKQNGRILAAGVGYQHEVNLIGPLVLNDELDRSYGKQRLLFNFQWIRPSSLHSSSYKNRGKGAKTDVRVTRRRQAAFRTELEYIVDNLSQFPLDRKYRLSWHNYFTYMPSVTNDVGLMVHTFLGRDYLNIRYDDVIFMVAGGIFVRIY